jgi:large subunit ribosomal protein L10
MNRDQKAAVVEEIAGQIRSSDAVFAVDYRGISVAQAAELRARLRESGTRFRVVKNSLTERAADEAGASALKELLSGPTALAFVSGDAAIAAKALSDAARALHTLEFKGGMMDSTALSAAEVQTIARLPAREVLHAQLVGTIAAPITGLVRTLNALIAGLAIQLQQIAEKGLVTGEAPAPAPAAEPAAAEPEPAEPEPEPAAAEPEAEAPEAEPPAAEPEAEAPAAEPEAAAEPEPEAEARPTEPIVDVDAEPGVPTPEETDQEAAPDEESGA